MENKDKEALNRLIQFAEKKEEDKPISYYMKKGAKWGGIGGAVGGLAVGTHVSGYIKGMTSDPEHRKLVIQRRTYNNPNSIFYGRDSANKDIDKIVNTTNIVAPIAGTTVYGLIGSGVGAATGAAYGGAKKLVRLIKKDK